MDKRIILGVHISKRAEQAAGVQKTFTEYGCNIKTRLGLHEADEKLCSSAGIVILEFFGDEPKADELAKKLMAVDGIEVKKMVFNQHD
ncbi:MAG: hypothetical protein ABIH04_08270 [Planctomycetota bacterium]